jgi:hypothetical protein
MGWFGNSNKPTPTSMREIVAKTGVKKDSDYIYYLGDDGNVWRKNDVSNVPIEMVAMAGVSKEDGFYYFIDTSGGNVCRIPVPWDADMENRVDLNILHLEDIIDKAEMSSIAEGHEEVIIDTDDFMKEQAAEYVKAEHYDAAIDIYEKLEMGIEANDVAILKTKKLEEYAKEREKHLDYQKAIELYENIEMPEEAARVRKLRVEQGSVKVTQKVVHGDEVTKTEIKDSVLNRSNVGSGSSKMQELEKLTEMKKEGLIDDDEFKQMKKEILGK